MEYRLLNGIYGKNDNIMLPQLTKNSNRDEGFVKKLFLPKINSLKCRCKYLNKAPFLLPVARIHRFFSDVFQTKVTYKENDKRHKNGYRLFKRSRFVVEKTRHYGLIYKFGMQFILPYTELVLYI